MVKMAKLAFHPLIMYEINDVLKWSCAEDVRETKTGPMGTLVAINHILIIIIIIIISIFIDNVVSITK